MTEPLLHIEGYGLELPTDRGWVRIIDDLDLDIGAGEIVGLAGESGSGKTLTALSITRLLPRRARTEGTIVVDGIDVLSASREQVRRLRGPTLGIVFQEPMTSLHPALRIGEQIAEAIRAHEPVGRAAAWARAVELLELVGIASAGERARQHPFEFSGGMQQRVMLAIALACRPKLLIADEPTTALDVTVQAQVVELLKRIQAELGMAILFVSHDLGLLAGLCKRMVVMYAGQVIEDAATEELFARSRHPYTDALLRAAPRPDLRGTRLPTIPGAPPRPGVLVEGCRFAPRCAHATAACEATPDLVHVAGTRVRCVRHAELDLHPLAPEAVTP